MRCTVPVARRARGSASKSPQNRSDDMEAVLRGILDKMPDKAPEFCFAGLDHWSTCMTKSEWTGWGQLLGTIGAVLLTWWLTSRGERARAARARMAHLLAIAHDVRISDRQASVYVSGKVKVPAYRLPLRAADISLPALIAEGVLDDAQATALTQFYVDATSFNYCLDLAQNLLNAGNAWEGKARLAKIKAGHLIPGTKDSRFDEAIRALRKAGVPEYALKRIPLGVRVEEEGDGFA